MTELFVAWMEEDPVSITDTSSLLYYLVHDCNCFHLIVLQSQVLPYALKESSSNSVVDNRCTFRKISSLPVTEVSCLMTQDTEGLY